MGLVILRRLVFPTVQWGLQHVKVGNDVGEYIKFPLIFPNQCATAIISDTYGRLDVNSSSDKKTEGANITEINRDAIQVVSYWPGGIDENIIFWALGY